jgi:hypothetical protein
MYFVGPEFFIYSIIALIFGIFLGITIGVKIQPWVETQKSKSKLLNATNVHP